MIRSLVWRYVSAMQRRFDDSAVTEDDINEVKSDISAMRYEMLEIFEKNGMDISSADKKEKNHLAKRMKVWERRLMKDFHVAPTTVEESNQVQEKGIERFRRVAKQVVSQTTSYRWTEAVRCVTDTQIGRCRNRESFRNQQNLARAMNEAKRLVEHSPIQSRPCTPVEYNDPTSNTLMALLKNISEEISEYSPAHTPRTERQNSITQQLQTILASRTPSPLPLSLLNLGENMAKIDNDFKINQALQSTSSQMNYEMNAKPKSASRPASPQPGSFELATVSPKSSESRKSSLNSLSSMNGALPKSPNATPRTSVTSLKLDINKAATNDSAMKPVVKSPPPAIQITRTESDRSTKSTVVEKRIEPKGELI